MKSTRKQAPGGSCPTPRSLIRRIVVGTIVQRVADEIIEVTNLNDVFIMLKGTEVSDILIESNSHR